MPVAIIGMGCLFPGRTDLARYWANIRDRRDAIAEVPETHWRLDDYFDPDPKAPDRTYARRGGFLAPVDFPPLEFGIAPNNLDATDTTQLLGLLVARAALEDAGYGAGRDFDRDRVSVILGVTGTLELVIPLGARLGHPDLAAGACRRPASTRRTADDVVRRISDSYVGWQENSFPGLLGNVAAGRIANRLDLRRHQLRHRRRLRQLARRPQPRPPRARRRPLRHGPHRRARYVQRHLHVYVLQQDAGAVAEGRCAAVRRGGRRHDPGRGARGPGPEAAGRRRGATATGSMR